MSLVKYKEFVEYLRAEGIKVDQLKLSQVIESYKLYLLVN